MKLNNNYSRFSVEKLNGVKIRIKAIIVSYLVLPFTIILNNQRRWDSTGCGDFRFFTLILVIYKYYNYHKYYDIYGIYYDIRFSKDKR